MPRQSLDTNGELGAGIAGGHRDRSAGQTASQTSARHRPAPTAEPASQGSFGAPADLLSTAAAASRGPLGRSARAAAHAPGAAAQQTAGNNQRGVFWPLPMAGLPGPPTRPTAKQERGPTASRGPGGRRVAASGGPRRARGAHTALQSCRGTPGRGWARGKAGACFWRFRKSDDVTSILVTIRGLSGVPLKPDRGSESGPLSSKNLRLSNNLKSRLKAARGHLYINVCTKLLLWPTANPLFVDHHSKLGG